MPDVGFLGFVAVHAVLQKIWTFEIHLDECAILEMNKTNEVDFLRRG